MARFPLQLVGFDLDGTLVDTAGDIAAAVDHALALADRPPLGVERVRPLIGGGTAHLLDQALAITGGSDAVLLDRLLPALFEYYSANIAQTSVVYSGVAEALRQLRERGVTLAVVTNKRADLADLLLEKLGLRGNFANIVGGDTVGIGKPDPAPVRAMLTVPGRAAYIGDSRYDVAAAHAAGLPVALFTAGTDDLGADATFAHYVDLIPTLERLAAT